MSEKVAVVTEASDGLGFSVVKCLCQKYNGIVYLTSSNAEKGLEAVDKLKKLELTPVFHQLDTSDTKSVKTFALFLKQTHGGIDVLVNNIPMMKNIAEYPDYETAKTTIDVEFRSFQTTEELLYPLLRNGARVVNISNDCGHLSNLRSKLWIDRLKSADLTKEEVDDFVNEYLQSVKNGTFEKDLFANEGRHADERVAKIAVVALTMIQQKKYKQRNISINALHPGLSKHGIGAKEPDEAAKSVLYLIFDASPKLTGTFMWHDRKLVDWLVAEEDDGTHYCKY